MRSCPTGCSPPSRSSLPTGARPRCVSRHRRGVRLGCHYWCGPPATAYYGCGLGSPSTPPTSASGVCHLARCSSLLYVAKQEERPEVALAERGRMGEGRPWNSRGDFPWGDAWDATRANTDEQGPHTV